MLTINLNSPEGNAYVLLGKAQNLSKQLGYSKEKTEDIMDRMKASDYDNLVNIFEEEFGHLVEIIR